MPSFDFTRIEPMTLDVKRFPLLHENVTILKGTRSIFKEMPPCIVSGIATQCGCNRRSSIVWSCICMHALVSHLCLLRTMFDLLLVHIIIVLKHNASNSMLSSAPTPWQHCVCTGYYYNDFLLLQNGIQWYTQYLNEMSTAQKFMGNGTTDTEAAIHRAWHVWKRSVFSFKCLA